MEEPENLAPGKKWHKRLAVGFLLLFATLWSLGSFFFWVLGGLSAIFAVLSLNSSGIKLPSFDPFARQANSYNSPGSGTSPRKPLNSGRFILIFMGVVLSISILVSIFSSPESVPAENSSDTNDEPTRDGDVASLTDKGNAFFNESQYDSALRYYKMALKLDASDQYAQYNMALVFFMMKDYRMSMGLIKKCLREHPDYNEAWWLLGDGYYSTNKYDSAAVSLERAYNNQFNDPNFLQLLGDVYQAQSNLSKATELYKKVIEQDTTKIEVYQQLIALDPDQAEFYRTKVKALSPK